MWTINSLKKNLIKNPCALEDFKYWTIDENGGDKWRIEDLPGGFGELFPNPSVSKYFVTSYRNEGYSMREIAKKLKISYNGVYYSLQRTAQTGSNQSRKRSGRPRCTTKQEDKHIRVSSLRNRHLTGPQLASSLNSTRKTPVSTSTVKRRLRDFGLQGRVAKKKPYLRLANKRKRLRWAKEHRQWTEEDWKKVLWTDAKGEQCCNCCKRRIL
ncbi:uncharacterized protein [Aquarana catesbeiana]|uniref:uncharacterized protein isoform X1 n=1 Tax=Aquarana catesbeiana TaxID=8400 RepID=UPI003CC9D9BB